MPTQFIQLPTAGAPLGLKVDANELTVNANTVERQNISLADPTTAAAIVTVSQFHNTDNVALGGTAYGLNTGGVAQLLNLSGNLDRQRETTVDGIPPTGIATGAAQFAMGFLTTDSTDNFALGTRTFTPVAMSGTVNGVAWSIQVGSVLTLDSGANKENVLVTAVTATTFTCVTAKAHNGTVTAFNITGFVYNQERDCAGENDGASGAGTAVAAEYEFNGGATAGTSNYDRARNLQGKGITTTTLTAQATAAATQVLLTAVTGLQVGQQIVLLGGTVEVVYVAANWNGSALTVPITTALINTHLISTNVSWSVHAPQGPGLNTFLADGEGGEAALIYDAASGNYATMRSASADSMVTANVPAESEALFNETNFDRARNNTQVAVLTSASRTTTQTSADLVNYNHRGLHVILDMTTVGTGSVTLTLNAKDPTSGKYYLLLAGAAVTANSTNIYRVYPGLTASANATASDILPRLFQIVVTANNANAATYSVAYSLVL